MSADIPTYRLEWNGQKYIVPEYHVLDGREPLALANMVVTVMCNQCQLGFLIHSRMPDGLLWELAVRHDTKHVVEEAERFIRGNPSQIN